MTVMTDQPLAPARSAPPAWLLVAIAVFINLVWALSYPVSKLVLDGVSVGAMTSWRFGSA